MTSAANESWLGWRQERFLAASGPSGGGPPLGAQPRRPVLLIVDDEEDIRLALQLCFANRGFEVVLAESGAEAVRLARETAFDMVITDLRMPGMSGAETITAVKALQPQARVIVLTGYASEETTADCLRRGACDYLRKPIDLEELVARVHHFLG